MFTTGFKFFFGLCVALAVSAVVYGYTTGGSHVGPITLGYKGAVGEHLGYGVLLGQSVVAGMVAVVLVAFRDADATAQADYMGVDRLDTAPMVSNSIWPVVGAAGVTTAAMGLVLHTAVFITGVVICALVALEWTMDAWSDRATADPAANKALRDRIMAPLEIPLAGLAVALLAVAAISRILLAVSKDGAVVVAGVVAVVIVAIAVLYVAKPHLGRNLVAGLVVLTAVGVLVGGILAAVAGERDFEVHGEEHGEEHSDDAEHDDEAPADEGSGVGAGEDSTDG